MEAGFRFGKRSLEQSIEVRAFVDAQCLDQDKIREIAKKTRQLLFGDRPPRSETGRFRTVIIDGIEEVVPIRQLSQGSEESLD